MAQSDSNKFSLAAFLGASAALLCIISFVTGKHHLSEFTGSSAAAATITSGYPSQPKPETVTNFTYGTWTLRQALDEKGTDWSGSVLKITAQEKTSDGLRLTGFFEWRIGSTLIGREHVAGNYVASNRQITFDGNLIEQFYGGLEHQLTKASYCVKLSEDDNHLVAGSWGNVASALPGIAGHWEAQR